MIEKIKEFWRDSTGRLILILFSITLLIMFVLGSIFDQENFFSGMLTEIAGLILSVLVGIFVVDWYVEFRKMKEWVKFKKQTLISLSSHICVICGGLKLHFYDLDDSVVGPIFEGQVSPPTDIVKSSIDRLLEELKKVPNPYSNGESIHDISVEYYEEFSWDLNQILSVLLPRIMQSSNYQELINRLIDFDGKSRMLHHSIFMHQLANTQFVFQDIENLITSAASVYEEITDLNN